MKRLQRVGIALASALFLTALVLFSYQQQAAAQTIPATPAPAEVDAEVDAEEGEVVAITPVRLDGLVVLSVTVRVGEDLTVTTPITVDVGSWIADLEGSTEITAGVTVGEPAAIITGVLTSAYTSTLTTTVDVAITGLITPVLSLVEIVEIEEDEEEAEEADTEPVIQAEALFDANLREGPGTDTAIVGGVQQGDIVVIIGANEEGDWYNLEDGSWIAAFLVELLEDDTVPVTIPDGDSEADTAEDEIDTSETESAGEAAEEDALDTDADAVAEEPTDEATEDATEEATPETDEESGEDADDAADSGPASQGINVELAVPSLLSYRVAVVTGLLNLVSGVESMGNLMQDPQLLSATWSDSMKAQAEVIRGSYQEISALTPPASAAAFHNDLLAALGDCDVAMDLLTNGLDSLDMDSLDQAATLMVQCGSKMENVIADYPEFLE